ncbi:MAG TPA: tyrosine-type recombinase/integrase [Spirochaetota bacterium]|nr:tyrosine-type recombinase/integrase [Spirochaetota bacterium]HNW27305.1 tyrosine-type recombinase/integrase [Spirochaetota bacterium]HPV43154.1 tyrosine-type recombinase/integrase [Spirochaetota bacterium]HPV43160.1 tyrosine-type recombinase/integrase [Spirochaetota bacterium]
MKELIESHIDAFISHEKLKGHTRKVVQRKERELYSFALFAGKPFGSVTCEDIIRYLSESPYPASFNRKLGYISQLFEFLIEQGEVLSNPAVGIDLKCDYEKHHRGVFSEEEVKLMIEGTSLSPVGKRDRAIVELFYSTGMRLFELANLNVDDVDVRNAEVFIERGKFGKGRMVPAGSEALKAVRKYLAVRDYFLRGSEYDALFLSLRGNRMSVSTIREVVKRRKRDAGITAIGAAHALRHSCASHLLKHGAPLPMIQRLLGHERLHATEIYTHLSEDDVIATMRKGGNGNDSVDV